MDPAALVEGGLDGISRVADALRGRGLSVLAVYLVKRVDAAEDEIWTLRIVLSENSPHLLSRTLTRLIDLGREGALPWIDERVRFDAVPLGNPEASRIVAYARQLGSPSAVIRNLMLDGIFVEYAMIAFASEQAANAA